MPPPAAPRWRSPSPARPCRRARDGATLGRRSFRRRLLLSAWCGGVGSALSARGCRRGRVLSGGGRRRAALAAPLPAAPHWRSLSSAKPRAARDGVRWPRSGGACAGGRRRPSRARRRRPHTQTRSRHTDGCAHPLAPRTRATTIRQRAATQRAAQPAAALRSLPARAPTAPTLRNTRRTQHIARHASHAAHRAPRSTHTHPTAPHGAQHTTHATRCAPSASRADRTATLRAVCSSLARTHARSTRRAATQWAPGPPSPRVRFRLVRRPHRAARNTPHTAHCAPSSHTRTHSARQAPHHSARQAPRQPKRPRRAATRRAPRPASASHSLPALAPTAPHGAQRATRATHCAPSARDRPHRNVARRLLLTRAHTQPERPAGRGAVSPQARRRPALASSSRAYRTAQCATGAPHASHAAPTHTHAHHDAPTRRDAAGPSARRRLALASGPRADRPARCAAHHARRTLCAVRFARRPIRNITRRLLITRAHTQPQRPASRDAADSPAHRRLTLASGSRAHRTAQCVAHNAHNTLRATLRAQHIARFRSPPRTRATTPRRRGATQRAAQPAAASRSPSAHAPTAPHPAQHAAHAALCAPRFARNTVRASLHTHAPDRTVTAPHGARAHYARNTLCAVRFATDRTAPLRAVCSSLAHTHCHERPDAPRRSGPRPAVASHSVPNRASIAPRSAQPATHAAHGVPSPHTRTPSARQAPHPSARQAPRSHKRPDAPRHGGPLSPPPSRAHFRLARQPRRPARSTPTRHTLCAFRFATDRTATLRAVRSSHAHTHSRNAAPTATQRAPQPAAASHPLRARAPAAPHSAQHLRTHTLRPTLAHGTLSAIRSPPTPTRNHNAPARRDAAGLSARRRLALASGSRADRTAPCATHFARNTLRATLRTQHIARRPLNTPRTQDHERPARRGVAVLSARRRLTLAYGSRANRTSQCATQRARNAPRTRPGAPFALTRAHTPKRDPTHRAQHAPSPPPPRTRFQLARRPHHTIRTTTRTSSLRAFSSSHARTHKRAQHATHAPRGAPRSTHRTHTALAKRSAALAKRPRAETHEPPARRATMRQLSVPKAPTRHTRVGATRHARTTLRASLRTPHTHGARQAPRRARQAPTRRDSRALQPAESRCARLSAPKAPTRHRLPPNRARQGWRHRSPPVFAQARAVTSPEHQTRHTVPKFAGETTAATAALPTPRRRRSAAGPTPAARPPPHSAPGWLVTHRPVWAFAVGLLWPNTKSDNWDLAKPGGESC